MKTTLDPTALASYTSAQLSSLFPEPEADHSAPLRRAMDTALERLERCFAEVVRGDYGGPEAATFDHLHTDQYCTYLYLLANSCWRHGEDRLAARVFALNKALHAFNCMYDTELPEVFLLIHTVGTVLGKATYGERLVVTQGCTVGAIGGQYPVLGTGVQLSAGASVIGPCRIGDDVVVGPGCSVVKTDVPDRTLVTVEHQLSLRERTASTAGAFFR